MAVDPTTHAVRADLADVALADRVFAPHYARAVPHRLTCSTALLATPDGKRVGEVQEGAMFDVLDVTASWAWGRCPELGLVGYLPADCIGPA